MTTPSANRYAVEIPKLNENLAAFIASLGGFALGVSLGWNSSANMILRNYSDASSNEIGLIGSILHAGSCLGAISIPFLAGRFARPRIMSVMSVVLILTWIALISPADQKVGLLIFGRLICGICGGALCVLIPTYVAEIVGKGNRTRLLMLFQVLINCGIMFAFAVAHCSNEKNAVVRYSSICGISCISLVPTILLYESPMYYLSRNDEISAAKSLRWYRGDTYNTQQEVTELKGLISAVQSKKLNMEFFRNRRVLRSIACCFVAMLGQHMAGVYTMTFHSLMLFDFIGSGDLTGSEQTVVVGAVQILASLLAMYLVDVLGRRVLLGVSSFLVGLFLILLGWFFSLRATDPEYDDIYFWMPPTWITLIFAAFNLGLAPVSWSLLGDTLPVEVRTPVASTVTTVGWLISLLTSLTFDIVIVSGGILKVMCFSVATCWLIAVLSVFLIRDNSGKSLAEIQAEFRINSASGEGEVG